VLEMLKAAPVCAAPGSPLDEQTLMGPLANRQQFEKVLQLIDRARRGRYHRLRRRSAARRRLFCLTDGGESPQRKEHADAEETFGPVCSFIGYQSEEEALARINASPFGLAASVWSDNIRKALRYSEAINAGIVWVNMHTFLDPAVPFGGMKGSGIGREFGSAFIDDYTELKSVMVRY
jgi:phenylacetaldehyde dehydrogenase